MILVMDEKVRSVILRPRSKIKDDGLSPSSLEIYDSMYMETCVVAEARWNADWNFCPVCMSPVDAELGRRRHLTRAEMEQ